VKTGKKGILNVILCLNDDDVTGFSEEVGIFSEKGFPTSKTRRQIQVQLGFPHVRLAIEETKFGGQVGLPEIRDFLGDELGEVDDLGEFPFL
jgi:hypothetical protein